MGTEEEIDDYLNGWENPLRSMLKRLKKKRLFYDDYYIYLVYPSDSTSPTPNLSTKLNLIDFNPIL